MLPLRCDVYMSAELPVLRWKKKLQFERFQNLIGAVSDKQKQEPNRTRFGLILKVYLKWNNIRIICICCDPQFPSYYQCLPTAGIANSTFVRLVYILPRSLHLQPNMSKFTTPDEHCASRIYECSEPRGGATIIEVSKRISKLTLVNVWHLIYQMISLTSGQINLIG